MHELSPAALFFFGLRGDEKGNVSVPCCFHDDANASASVNMDKGLLNCFSCNKGWTFEQVEAQIADGGDVATVPNRPSRDDFIVPDQVLAHITPDAKVVIEPLPTVEEYLAERGLESFDRSSVPLHIEDGYLHFGKDVARNLGEETNTRPRYRNAPGMKGVFWVRKQPGPVWLTEGVIDAMTLAMVLGDTWSIAATLGSSMTDRQAYELRGRTVFVAYDADHAGYTGSRKAAEKLREFGANPILLDFPEAIGKDVNEAWLNDRDSVREWVSKVKAEFATMDVSYVERLFSGTQDDLLTLSSGIESWDDILGGGFRPGLHTVGAETGVGKTSWAKQFMVTHAERGTRVLGVTYEIPKRQEWARLASIKDPLDWQALEAAPEMAQDTTIDWVGDIARNLRIVSGWTVPKISYVAEHYDAIVVDYLQRMPGPFGGDAIKQNIDHNIAALSDLGRDMGKVVIAISSLNRAAYGTQEISRKDFKESGNIEFVSQSLTGLRREGAGTLVMGNVVKNTRGREDRFFMEADLAHQTFESALAPWDQPRTKHKSTATAADMDAAEGRLND